MKLNVLAGFTLTSFMLVSFLGSQAPATISISSPVPGVSTTSPVQASASADGTLVRFMQLYLDGVLVPQSLVAGKSLSKSVTIAVSGSHTFTFETLDSNKTHINSATVMFSISTTPPPPGAPCGAIDNGSVNIPPLYAQPPNIPGFAPPPKGGTFSDMFYGCPITRLSDGRTTSAVHHEYANMSSINSNDTLISLNDSGGWYITDFHGNIVIPTGKMGITGVTGPRWDLTSPNLLYVISQNNAISQGLISGTSIVMSMIRSFPEYTQITFGKGEGDIEKDHAVVVGTTASGSREVFIYTFSTKVKSSVLVVPAGQPLDNVQLTPTSFRAVVNWGVNGTSVCSPGPCRYGFELYDQNMKFVRSLSPYIAHSKESVDLQGNEVLIVVDSGPRYCGVQGIATINVNTAVATCIARNFPWHASMHVGASSNGWVVAEHVDYRSPATASYPLAANWQSLWLNKMNELFLIRIDGSKIYRLAHHRSYPDAQYYWKIPRPSISRDGKYVVFDSDFGFGNPVPNYTDAYLIKVQ